MKRFYIFDCNATKRAKAKMVLFCTFLVLLIVSVIAGAQGIAEVAFGNAIFTSSQKRKLPIYSVKTDEKKLAITFDCAWENKDTDEIIALLDKYNIKATFFATGDFCKRHSDDIKKFANAGHSIQNHSYSHPHVAAIEPQKLIEDTIKCDDIIEEITGKKPILYRAPYGEFSDRMLLTFEQNLKHKVIQWDCDSIDWKNPTPNAIVNRIMKKVNNGSILLFHNDTAPTVPALKQLIPLLLKEGYEFVLVEDMIAFDNYTIDYEGRQVLVDKF